MKKIIVTVVLFVATISFAQNWNNSLEDAKTMAAKENKKILLVFSGSDWCAPCMKLEKTVWKSDVFKKEAESKWVLIKADFPKKKANQLPAEQTEINKKLAEKYNKEGNFPLVVLLDEKGKVQGMTGFKNVSAEEYVKLLNSLQK
ncbi:MAG: thioredoxin family protein [Flavobacterium sp.]|nr:thioredoxin family protein [Flavobacterium sp.]